MESHWKGIAMKTNTCQNFTTFLDMVSVTAFLLKIFPKAYYFDNPKLVCWMLSKIAAWKQNNKHWLNFSHSHYIQNIAKLMTKIKIEINKNIIESILVKMRVDYFALQVGYII